MRDKAPHCIFCWEAIDGEIMQPLFAGPGAQQGAEPIAWVHKDCLEEYTTDPSEYEPKVIAAGAELGESGADEDEGVSSELDRETCRKPRSGSAQLPISSRSNAVRKARRSRRSSAPRVMPRALSKPAKIP
jgi:hypothetical protein